MSNLWIKFIVYMYVCMHVKEKHSIYKVQYYPQFQTSVGGSLNIFLPADNREYSISKLFILKDIWYGFIKTRAHVERRGLSIKLNGYLYLTRTVHSFHQEKRKHACENIVYKQVTKKSPEGKCVNQELCL